MKVRISQTSAWVFRRAVIRIRGLDRGIAEDFKPFVIVVGQKRQKKSADRMYAEIPRNITDAKAPVGRAVVVVRTYRSLQWIRMSSSPAFVFGQQVVRSAASFKLQDVKEIAVNDWVSRRQFDRPPVIFDGLLDPAQFFERIGEIVAGLRRLSATIEGPLESASTDSSIRPISKSVLARLLWAPFISGLRRIASRQAATDSSNRPHSRRALLRLQ